MEIHFFIKPLEEKLEDFMVELHIYTFYLVRTFCLASKYIK